MEDGSDLPLWSVQGHSNPTNRVRGSRAITNGLITAVTVVP